MNSAQVYVAARFWWGVAWSLMTTMSLVYMVVEAGLDPLQMVLIGTALELSVFLFEIPTGVVADLVSRRLSVIIGHLGVGVGFLVVGLVPEFWAILAANVFWGVSYTFISGAYPAWLSSEVGKERAGEAILKGSQFSHAGSFVGIALAVWLAHTSLSLPIVVGSIALIGLSIFLALAMRETNFAPEGDDVLGRYQRFAQTFQAGVGEVRARPVLISILLVTGIFGMFSEGVDRLFTPLVIEGFELPALGPLDGVVWWGIIAAVSHALGMVAVRAARRRVKLADVRRLTWVTGGALVVVSFAVIALSWSSALALVLGFYWLAQTARSVYGPLMTAWLNRLLPESGKATLFSIYGQADALGQTVGGPVVGYIAKQVSISVGLTVSAVLLLPGAWLLRRTGKRLAKRE